MFEIQTKAIDKCCRNKPFHILKLVTDSLYVTKISEISVFSILNSFWNKNGLKSSYIRINTNKIHSKVIFMFEIQTQAINKCC